MALICNFTPDDITWQHTGIQGTLKAGEIEEYPDGRANHILNSYGIRGLLRYKLNEDPEEKRKDAIRMYKRFWINQITNFNQQNEARKNENSPYNFPSEQLSDKAEEFGVQLVAPWKMQEKTDSAQVSELKAENKELKYQIDALKGNMDEMLGILKSLKDKPATPIVIDTADLIKRFITLDKAKYKGWVMKNAEEIAGWPNQVIEKAQEKWSAFYPDMDWPLSGSGDADGDVS